ncbi:hypothetical protein ES703_63687 [subsurface metagenome]
MRERSHRPLDLIRGELIEALRLCENSEDKERLLAELEARHLGEGGEGEGSNPSPDKASGFKWVGLLAAVPLSIYGLGRLLNALKGKD